MVTVLLVDGDAHAREETALVLKSASYGTEELGFGEGAVEAALSGRVDVVILSVDLPGVSGYEVCAQLRDRLGSRIPIILVSTKRTDPLDRVAGLLIGADDYLIAPFKPDELLARVRALLRRSVDGPGDRGGRGAHPALTAREREILGLLARGQSTSEIATELVISPKTVGTHTERIFGKLGVHSRAQAVSAAYRLGLVEIR